MQSRKSLLILGAALITVGACSKKDAAATNDTATAMTIDSSAMRTDLRDSVMIQDSIRMDSIRRADSIRIVDTLNQPPQPDK